MMTSSVVLYADLHMNSTMGLCIPGIERDDGEIYQLNDIQRWLFQVWEKANDRIDEITKNTERYNFFMGDTVDIDPKGLSNQFVSHNPATPLKIAKKTLEPIIQKGDYNFFIRGTDTHTGSESWGEEELGADFSAVMDPTTKGHSWWHWRGEIEQLRFDLAHTWAAGGLPWTRGNAASKLASQTMFEYMEMGEPLPHVVGRAHGHRWADSGKTYFTRAFLLPCFQWKTNYTYKRALQNAKFSIGVVVLICDKGHYSLHDMLFQPKRAPLWQKSLATSI